MAAHTGRCRRAPMSGGAPQSRQSALTDVFARAAIAWYINEPASVQPSIRPYPSLPCLSAFAQRAPHECVRHGPRRLPTVKVPLKHQRSGAIHRRSRVQSHQEGRRLDGLFVPSHVVGSSAGRWLLSTGVTLGTSETCPWIPLCHLAAIPRHDEEPRTIGLAPDHFIVDTPYGDHDATIWNDGVTASRVSRRSWPAARADRKKAVARPDCAQPHGGWLPTKLREGADRDRRRSAGPACILTARHRTLRPQFHPHLKIKFVCRPL